MQQHLENEWKVVELGQALRFAAEPLAVILPSLYPEGESRLGSQAIPVSPTNISLPLSLKRKKSSGQRKSSGHWAALPTLLPTLWEGHPSLDVLLILVQGWERSGGKGCREGSLASNSGTLCS